MNWLKNKKRKSGPAPESTSKSTTSLANIVKLASKMECTTITRPLASSPAGQPENQISEGKAPSGYIKRLQNRLFKTRKTLAQGFDRILTGKKGIDADVIEELEELLVTSDVGVKTAMELIGRIAASGLSDVDQIKAALKDEILSILSTEQTPAETIPGDRPHVIMVVGVNGAGKTTTIGKLAAKATASGKKVLIAASDTFRAAAVEQLVIWAERAGADIVKHGENADPAAVAFDAITAATARDVDYVLIDTAGRLHTKVNLMEELKKIKRSISKKLPGAPHEILLVLDATTGQNAISQAKLFNDALEITALALTKLDGTAKGGIVISICSSLNIPLKYIGIGEQIEDLQRFEPKSFVQALF